MNCGFIGHQRVPFFHEGSTKTSARRTRMNVIDEAHHLDPVAGQKIVVALGDGRLDPADELKLVWTGNPLQASSR